MTRSESVKHSQSANDATAAANEANTHDLHTKAAALHRIAAESHGLSGDAKAQELHAEMAQRHSAQAARCKTASKASDASGKAGLDAGGPGSGRHKGDAQKFSQEAANHANAAKNFAAGGAKADKATDAAFASSHAANRADIAAHTSGKTEDKMSAANAHLHAASAHRNALAGGNIMGEMHKVTAQHHEDRARAITSGETKGNQKADASNANSLANLCSLKASERMSSKAALVAAVAKLPCAAAALRASVSAGGYSLNDLQSNVRDAVQGVAVLNATLPGQSCCCWVADIVPPVDADDVWTAIVNGADGNLYAQDFDVDASGDVTLDGDPQEVQRTTDYDYIGDIGDILSFADAAGKRGLEAENPEGHNRYTGSGMHPTQVAYAHAKAEHDAVKDRVNDDVSKLQSPATDAPKEQWLAHYSKQGEIEDKHGLWEAKDKLRKSEDDMMGAATAHIERQPAYQNSSDAQKKDLKNLLDKGPKSVNIRPKLVDSAFRLNHGDGVQARAATTTPASLHCSSLAFVASAAAAVADACAEDADSHELAAEAHGTALAAHKAAHAAGDTGSLQAIEAHYSAQRQHAAVAVQLEAAATSAADPAAVRAFNVEVGNALFNGTYPQFPFRGLDAGDFPGHPFRGNQYSGGRGGAAGRASGKAHAATKDAKTATDHKTAAVLHRKAAAAHAKKGDAETADYHRLMGQYHDSAAADMKKPSSGEPEKASKEALSKSKTAIHTDKDADHKAAAEAHEKAQTLHKAAGNEQRAAKHGEMAQSHRSVAGGGYMPRGGGGMGGFHKKKKEDEKKHGAHKAADAGAEAGLQAADSDEANPAKLSVAADAATKQATDASATADDDGGKAAHRKASKGHQSAHDAHEAAYAAHSKAGSDTTILDKHMAAMADHTDAAADHDAAADEVDACETRDAATVRAVHDEVAVGNPRLSLDDVATEVNRRYGASVTSDQVAAALVRDMLEAGGPGSGRRKGEKVFEQQAGSKDITQYNGKEYADKLSERADEATKKANNGGDAYDHAEARTAHESAAMAQGKWGSEDKMKAHNGAATYHWGKVCDAMDNKPAQASDAASDDQALSASASRCVPLDCASADNFKSFATEEGSLLYMPGGVSTITPSQNGRPVTVCLDVTAEAADLLEDQRKALTGKNKKPFFSIQHSTDVAAFWPAKFSWDTRVDATGKNATGIWADGEWTAAGKEARDGKNFRSFSPTFHVDSTTYSTDNPSHVICQTEARANMGALENDPAFTRMSALWAKDAAQSGSAQPDVRAAVRQCHDALAAMDSNLTLAELVCVMNRNGFSVTADDAARHLAETQ